MARAVERLAAIWALLGGLGLLAIMLVTSTNIAAFLADTIAEHFGGNVSALSGYEDFVRLAIAPSALSFLPYCQLKRGHVAVDIFVDRLPVPVQRGMDRLFALLMAALALFLLYFMTLGMLETRSDSVVTPVIGWPEWPFYAPGLVSLALWALVALMQAAESEAVEPEAADG